METISRLLPQLPFTSYRCMHTEQHRSNNNPGKGDTPMGNHGATATRKLRAAYCWVQ